MITRVLIWWNIGVWAYMVLVGWLMMRASHVRIRKIAEREDKAGVAVLAVMSLAAALSLMAIVMELASTKNLSSSQRLLHHAFTGITVIGSWLLVVTIYTFHYANLFYRSPPEQRCLHFPENEQIRIIGISSTFPLRSPWPRKPWMSLSCRA